MRKSKEQEILDAFLAQGEGVVPTARWHAEVNRANGNVERRELGNVITADGLNAMAAQMLNGLATGVNSPFSYIAVGTVTDVGSLGSVLGGIGEVGRKVGSTITTSKNAAIMVTSWGGAADSLTGVALGCAGIINHADSGSGTLGNHVTSLGITLADSDTLKLQCDVTVGSHNL